jgi:hypothetical protein
LKRIAHLAGHLAFAEVKLAIVLVKDNHSAGRFATPRREQEGRNEVFFESPVLDPFSVESGELFDVATLERHRNRVGKPQARSKCRSEIGHDLQ